MTDYTVRIPYIAEFYPLAIAVSFRTEPVTSIGPLIDGGVGDVPNPMRMVGFKNSSGQEQHHGINDTLLEAYARKSKRTVEQLAGTQVTVIYDTKDPRPEFHVFLGIVNGLEQIVIGNPDPQPRR